MSAKAVEFVSDDGVTATTWSCGDTPSTLSASCVEVGVHLRSKHCCSCDDKRPVHNERSKVLITASPPRFRRDRKNFEDLRLPSTSRSSAFFFNHVGVTNLWNSLNVRM